MSVIASDIKYYYTGSGSSADPGASLGGAVTANEVGTTINKLFDDVSADEASAGDTEYRAIDVKNTNIADTLYDAYIWISLETTSADTTVAIGYDSAGSQTVANESTAPSSPTITFSTPVTKATGISLGDIGPEVTKRIWVRRTTSAGAAKASDSGTLIVEGGTI